MKTVITVRIHDADWLEMSDESKAFFKNIKEPEDLELMKYKQSYAVETAFSVQEYAVNNNATIDLPGFQLTDFTSVLLKGEGEEVTIHVSNSLLASEFAATKSGGKRYCYFFIKPDTDFFRMSNIVWLDRSAFEILKRHDSTLES